MCEFYITLYFRHIISQSDSISMYCVLIKSSNFSRIYCFQAFKLRQTKLYENWTEKIGRLSAIFFSKCSHYSGVWQTFEISCAIIWRTIKSFEMFVASISFCILLSLSFHSTSMCVAPIWWCNIRIAALKNSYKLDGFRILFVIIAIL